MRTEGFIIGGAAAGAAVPLILREYVDKPTSSANIVDQFKKPSVLVGVGGGLAATIGGVFFGNKLGNWKWPLIAFGAPALVSGAYSAMFPKESGGTAGLRARQPVRITSSGGSSSSGGSKTY